MSNAGDPAHPEGRPGIGSWRQSPSTASLRNPGLPSVTPRAGTPPPPRRARRSSRTPAFPSDRAPPTSGPSRAGRPCTWDTAQLREAVGLRQLAHGRVAGVERTHHPRRFTGSRSPPLRTRAPGMRGSMLDPWGEGIPPLGARPLLQTLPRQLGCSRGAEDREHRKRVTADARVLRATPKVLNPGGHDRGRALNDHRRAFSAAVRTASRSHDKAAAEPLQIVRRPSQSSKHLV
jgi:hypothetical protein